MERYFGFLLLFIASFSSIYGQFDIYNPDDYKSINTIHDVTSLKNWGPYSKKYAGISHIPEMQSGMRLDVTIVPGFYRNRIMVPNVLFESGYFPWHINANMSKITYRYELEWKDRVFVDASYSVIDSSNVLVSMRCVNQTSLPQVLQLNLLASINYPNINPDSRTVCPEKVSWVNGVKYKSIQFSVSRPTDNLVYNGWLNGEERDKAFLDGRALGDGFGSHQGDKVSYKLNLDKSAEAIALYCQVENNETLSLQLNGLVDDIIEVKGDGKFQLVTIPISKKTSGDAELILECLSDEAFKLNGIFIGSKKDLTEIKIEKNLKNFYPRITKSEKGNDLYLKYPDVDQYYGMAWDFPQSAIREIFDEELDVILRKYVHEHVSKVFYGDSLGHYTNAFMRPVEIQAYTEKTFYALICVGSENDVVQTLAKFQDNPDEFIALELQTDNLYQNILPEGSKYTFSQNMMQAALLSNIVYPIYTQDQFIRHFAPGKWWNSLYTWDSGFEALGMSEIDKTKAIQILNAYTTPVGSQSAFIHHGSPVPVQIYAFYDIWNKTQSRALLEYFYPRLKQYYEFMAGKVGSSTTGTFHSNLLRTWDYFYNSGGWDDYPPQKAVHDNRLESKVSPVITTAQCIRVAKMLRKAAEVQGFKSDMKEFDKDIKLFSDALQNIAWDDESEYFSYVVHDSLNNPLHFLRYSESGQNYNMGLDGAYPVFSGICNPEQEKGLLEKIFSDEHMWTPAGICVVDKEAAYYRNDGYWNGTVWMSHQWFMWKTMLDLGQCDYAFKIAGTALDLWKKETDETYFTYEHFIVDVVRGAGWHQFGALSAPVLNWFASYYKPGTATTGFEIWIKSQFFSNDNSSYEALLSFDNATKPHIRSMLVCMNPDFDYQVLINGKKAEFSKRYNGLIEIYLPASNKDCKLTIKKL